MNKDTTVGELAKKLGNVQIHTLIEKLTFAGVNVSKVTDLVTFEQQQKVLDLLKEPKEPNKISLKRRAVVSQIKVKNATGGNTTVSVVRKNRRVFIKEDLPDKSGNDLSNDLTTIAPKQDFINPETPQDLGENIALNSEQSTVEIAAGTGLKLDQKPGILPEIDPNATVTKDQNANKPDLDKSTKATKGKKDKKDKDNNVEEDESINKKVKTKTNKSKDKNISHSKVNLNLLTKGNLYETF